MRISARLLATCAVVALAMPASALAQASRTWVSGVGDDVNPCSRTAPCKTFAGAISKTAAKGIINVLDPGGFGAVTITKSITIDGGHMLAGIVNASVNGIVVNAAATDDVRLLNLDIEGVGTGVNGIRILQARSVKISNVNIYGQTQNGIDFEPSNTGAKLTVLDSLIEQNTGNGVLVAPPNGKAVKATLRRNEINDNGCGVAATRFGPSGNFNSQCGTNAPNANVATAAVSAFDNSFSESTATGGTGVFANGTNAVIRIGHNYITNNPFGLQALNSGQVVSWGDNYFAGNSTDGTPTGTLTTG